MECCHIILQKIFLKVKLFLKIDCLLGQNGKKQVPRKNSKKNFFEVKLFLKIDCLLGQNGKKSSEKNTQKNFFEVKLF